MLRNVIWNSFAVFQLPTNHTSYVLSKRFFYEQTRSGTLDLDEKKNKEWNEMNEVQRAIKAAQFAKKDIKWSWERFKNGYLRMFSSDNTDGFFDDNEIVKLWDFDHRNSDKISSVALDYKIDKCDDMKNWFKSCDADFDVGFSRCSWTVSPSGYALFSGYLDTTIPKDGRITRAGYAYVASNKSRVPFQRSSTNPMFEDFTHLIMRVRGDGRRYFIGFDTSEDTLDFTWFDRYQYMVYTHGGPYWQFIKIPLNRFFFSYQGVLQDEQFQINPELIKNVGIMAQGHTGTFSLEIDYIGFLKDFEYNDENEYEGYYHEVSSLKTL